MDNGPHSYIIDTSHQIDLSKLNFTLLRSEFPEKKYKNIQFADLKKLMEIKLNQIMAQNKTRGSFIENFQRIIDDYNTGGLSIEAAYGELLKQAEAMNEEQGRAAKNNMTEEEQQLFDLLKNKN